MLGAVSSTVKETPKTGLAEYCRKSHTFQQCVDAAPHARIGKSIDWSCRGDFFGPERLAERGIANLCCKLEANAHPHSSLTVS